MIPFKVVAAEEADSVAVAEVSVAAAVVASTLVRRSV